MARVRVDSEKCDGCGTYVSVCPVGVYELRENRSFVVSEDGCLVCKACETQCPKDAIAVLE